MLFTFGYFWKTLLTVLGAWILYGLLGFEFAVITILALILAMQYKN
jgi:hypothetical protein